MPIIEEPVPVFNIKLVVLGYYSVGKSSLALRYVKGVFNPFEESTIGAAFLTKTLISKGSHVKFEIWDTAGQERYNSLIPMYYRGAEVALIVYDITNVESYETAKRWVDELKQEKPAGFLKVLIGNKTDLEDQRRISFEKGMHFAEQNDLLFYETSAKSDDKIVKIFEDIAEIIPRLSTKKKEVHVEKRHERNFFGCC